MISGDLRSLLHNKLEPECVSKIYHLVQTKEEADYVRGVWRENPQALRTLQEFEIETKLHSYIGEYIKDFIVFGNVQLFSKVMASLICKRLYDKGSWHWPHYIYCHENYDNITDTSTLSLSQIQGDQLDKDIIESLVACMSMETYFFNTEKVKPIFSKWGDIFNITFTGSFFEYEFGMLNVDNHVVIHFDTKSENLQLALGADSQARVSFERELEGFYRDVEVAPLIENFHQGILTYDCEGKELQGLWAYPEMETDIYFDVMECKYIVLGFRQVIESLAETNEVKAQ